MPDELRIPPLRPGLREIWAAFLELAGRRQTGGFGPGPLTFPDLEAWARLTGRQLTPLHVRWLCRLDDCWLASHHEAIRS